MNAEIARHIAALAEGQFEASAIALRRTEQDVDVSLTDLGPDGVQSLTVALEVGRDGRNFQRNLVLLIQSNERDRWDIDLSILDEDQSPVVKVAEAEVGDDDLAEVVFAIVRAGRARLLAELNEPVAA